MRRSQDLPGSGRAGGLSCDKLFLALLGASLLISQTSALAASAVGQTAGVRHPALYTAVIPGSTAAAGPGQTGPFTKAAPGRFRIDSPIKFELVGLVALGAAGFIQNPSRRRRRKLTYAAALGGNRTSHAEAAETVPASRSPRKPPVLGLPAVPACRQTTGDASGARRNQEKDRLSANGQQG